MRTNIELDDDLMAQAMAATGLVTKRATVAAELRLLAQLRGQSAALEDLRGLGWEGDLGARRERRDLDEA